MFRRLVLLLALGALVGATACAPLKPRGNARYIDKIFGRADVARNIHYATVPDLVTGQPVALHFDVYAPAGDAVTNRPAVIWVHGGGFRNGSKANTAQVAYEYAQRGYVTFSINYRLDPGNRCQDIGDGTVTDPAEIARCEAAILAAQHDAQAVVRWARANAAALGVDPGRIAMGGFSAGAVTALGVAYRSHDPGDVGEYDGVDSSIQAAISASGCAHDRSAIGPGDAPVFLLHAEHDRGYTCAQIVAGRARAAGLVADEMYFQNEATHAMALYEKYKARVDAAWTLFLVAQLHLY
jgi:acetyl esterase/lipase